MIFNVFPKSEFPKKPIRGHSYEYKLIGCWVSAELSFCAYNFLSDGKGFYSFFDAKKEFTYTDNGDNVIIHFSGDLISSTFKYTIEDDILLIEDSFGALVKYKRNKEEL